MAALPDPERPWPRRRLLSFVAACFLAQVIFIVLFGERRVSALKPPVFSTAVSLVTDPWSIEQLTAFTELTDPAMFALPSLDGFSRAGWLTYKPVTHDISETPDEPKWLQLDPALLGRDLAAYVASNSPGPIRIGDQSMPELAGMQPRPSSELEFDKSELRIFGALARRKLLSAMELRSWPHNDVLTNSVVHLLVDGEGIPISAALVSGSGLREADDHALALSKRLRFKPERQPGAVTSGTANFIWQTVPPRAATNVVSPGLLP